MRLDPKAIDLGPIAICAVNDARLYQTSYVANGAVLPVWCLAPALAVAA